jgi:hypothetical protein
MRHPIAKIATTASAALLAGAMLFAAAPASAAVPSSTKASDPYSVFEIRAKATKKVKAGGWINYSIRAVNTGPYLADYYWIGGIIPKGVDPDAKLYWDGPKGNTCDYQGREFWCWGKYALKVDDTDWLTFRVKMKKGTHGTATAKLGVISYDVPTGADTLNKELLKKLGIKSWIFSKTVKTKITR